MNKTWGMPTETHCPQCDSTNVTSTKIFEGKIKYWCRDCNREWVEE